MSLFNVFGKRDVSSELTGSAPYRMSTEWIPYKLYANRANSTSLMIKLKNMTSEVLLTSVVVEVPRQLGLDELGVAKQREMRLGKMAPGEERDLRFNVFGGLNADAGEYTVVATAIAHYLDYGHVINAIRKRTTVQVV